MVRPIDPRFSLLAAAARPGAKPRPAPTGLLGYAYDGADHFVRGLLGLEQDPGSPRTVPASAVPRAAPAPPTHRSFVAKQKAPLRARQAAPARPSAGADGAPAGVDWEFIGLSEGDGKKAHVPKDKKGRPIENSGVTVAHGLDLGAQDARELEIYGLSPDMIERFTPYLGVRGEQAVSLLNTSPLTVTAAEQRDIDEKVRARAHRETAANFDKSATGGVKFEHLPEEAKTVLVDLWFQYPHPAKSIPKFWGHATSGRWQDAYDELNDFGDHYGRRRSREADRLNRAIQSGKLK